MSDEWKIESREECPQKLFELVKKKTDQDKQDILDHIDNRFKSVAPTWQMAINNKTHSIINSTLIVIIFLFMAVFLTSC
jgi:hypothetical protein